MTPSLPYFDQIYVATIARNAKRQESLRRIATEHGLILKFFSGVDGHNLETSKLAMDGIYEARRSLAILGYELTPNEIACSMTHQAVLVEFLRNVGNRVALILEDDVRIVSENFIPSEITAAFASLNNMPAWDLLYLGYEDMNRRMPFSIRVKNSLAYPLLNYCRIRQYDRARIRRCFGRPVNKHWFRAGVHNGAYAYAVSRQGAEKILAYNTPIWAPADVVLMHLIRAGELTAYAMEQRLFRHDWAHGTSIGARASWR